MKGRELLRGWARCWASSSEGSWIRSADGNWTSPFLHSRPETTNSFRQKHSTSLLSECFKQASKKYFQTSDVHLVQDARLAMGRLGSTITTRGCARLHYIFQTHRLIVTRSCSLREMTQNIVGWSGQAGPLRGRGQKSKGFSMFGIQRYQRRTLYGGGSAEQAVWALIGVNAFVFFLWQMGPNDLMARHFQASWDAIKSGRIHTLVTSAFSQASPSHLFTNMIGLYFFGTEIAQIFGSKYLVTLYLAGGVAASVGHLLYWAYYVPWSRGVPRKYYDPRYTPGAMGASGAVNAIIILNVLLNPTRIVYVNLIIPVPAALLGLLLIGSDLWSARNDSSSTSHAGHLAGALVGIIAYFVR